MKLHALINVSIFLCRSARGEFGEYHVRSTSAIVAIARATVKVSLDTYRYAETCPGHRATAQGRIRIDITAYSDAFVCFTPTASLPCLGHVNAPGDKVHVRDARVRVAWTAHRRWQDNFSRIIIHNKILYHRIKSCRDLPYCPNGSISIENITIINI